MAGMRNARFRHIEANRIAGSLGAEIAGVDLGQDIGDEAMAEIRAALHDNLVIFFRDQELTPERQLAFARRWGEIHLHPFIEGLADHPEIIEIRKAETDKRNFGGTWHSDQMFAPQPAMGTMLYARQVPEAGGDTMFTNQYLAYETLSDGMRRMLDPLRAVSVGEGGKKYGGKSRREFYADRLTTVKVRDTGDLQTTSAHPLVRTHPETGRKRALHRQPRAIFRGHDGGGEPAADRLPHAPLDAAGVHLPFCVADRLAGVLGQSLHPAFRDQRLSRRNSPHAPDHHSRRHAVSEVARDGIRHLPRVPVAAGPARRGRVRRGIRSGRRGGAGRARRDMARRAAFRSRLVRCCRRRSVSPAPSPRARGG